MERQDEGDRALQLFISVFVPLNSVSRKIEGDEATLPYVGTVGQVNLLHIPPEECEIVIDSENMASEFNLYRMPVGWRGLFVYEKMAPAPCFGHSGDKPSYVALRTVPMGWLSAVGVVQAAIRHLAFSIGKLPGAAEVQKWKELPADNKIILYLDSIDQLRLVSKAMIAEHRKFREACESKGLPTNAAKSLSGAIISSLQGGELRSADGAFGLHPDSTQGSAYACWPNQSGTMLPWRGWWVDCRLVFACAFRRCQLALRLERTLNAPFTVEGEFVYAAQGCLSQQRGRAATLQRTVVRSSSAVEYGHVGDGL